MRIVLPILLLFFPAALRAQDSVVVIPLRNDHRDIKGLRTVPFNRIVVLDNRFDTIKLRMVEDGRYPVKIEEFDGPASGVIAAYLQDAVRGLPAANRTLVLDLQQFRFGNSGSMLSTRPRSPQIRHCLFMYIDAYLSDDGAGLRRICSFRKPIFLSFYDAYHLTMAATSGLDELLKAIGTATPATDSVAPSDGHRTTAVERWAGYPVNQSNSAGADGIYRSFDDFLADKVNPASMSLSLTADSVFSLRFTDRHASKFREKRGYPRVWGVRYHGKRYIGIRNPFTVFSKNSLFLPLEPKNNTFYFHIPSPLPNMYSMLSTGSVDFESPQPNGDNLNSYEYNRESLDRLSRIVKRGLIPGHRDCFLDMDSGDIIYN